MPTMPANGCTKNGSTTMHTASVTALRVLDGRTLILLLLLVLSSLLTLADCIRCQRLLATAASCHKMGLAPTHLEAMLICGITCLSACLPAIDFTDSAGFLNWM